MNILIMLRFESKIKATRLKIKDTTLKIYFHGYVKYYNIVQNLKKKLLRGSNDYSGLRLVGVR